MSEVAKHVDTRKNEMKCLQEKYGEEWRCADVNAIFLMNEQLVLSNFQQDLTCVVKYVN